MRFQSLCKKTLSETALMHSSNKKNSSNHTINLKENNHVEEIFQNKLHESNRVEDFLGTVLCESYNSLLFKFSSLWSRVLITNCLWPHVCSCQKFFLLQKRQIFKNLNCRLAADWNQTFKDHHPWWWLLYHSKRWKNWNKLG